MVMMSEYSDCAFFVTQQSLDKDVPRLMSIAAAGHRFGQRSGAARLSDTGLALGS